MRRRDFVLGALGAGALSYAQPATALAQQRHLAIPYGAAIRDGVIAEDPLYAQAVIDYCQVVVGEGNLKWGTVQPERGTFDFQLADDLLAFATKNGMEMRGHCLVWYAGNPDWVETIASAEEARTEMVRHIETVMGHYKGRVRSWDVVNEPIADAPTTGAVYRDSVWLKHLGPEYADLALRTAAAVDPEAQLVINDYDFEQSSDKGRAKRKAFLDMVRGLQSRDVPLHAVGLQGHIQGQIPIDKPGLTAFVAELASMGLSVLVTELDVIDNLLPGAELERDGIIAQRAKDYLDAIAAAKRPDMVLTWGITDKHTWVPIWFSRDDGLPNRPLPLDADYKPKALMDVIQDFCAE
ncbi:glycoside hydrolase family 10 [Devosia soli]|uniref:Beta-xylanase n=1 Tax=Devosia soli TaxID=361041 RepID=A0A0F5L7D2_9HYPH|nr:endo-1,4-beta-xylanase [Devosia soli]KKB78263.1 glycoside hydrolase family 10 [Devosia soli]